MSAEAPAHIVQSCLASRASVVMGPLARFASDCGYGIFAALFVRGRHSLAYGDFDAARADWDW